jgi:membrane protein implicated in regulation of membrane protease activity
MTTAELSASAILATPEIIMAVAAMALLMIGVFSGPRANTTVTGLAVAVLISAMLWWRGRPERHLAHAESLLEIGAPIEALDWSGTIHGDHERKFWIRPTWTPGSWM